MKNLKLPLLLLATLSLLLPTQSMSWMNVVTVGGGTPAAPEGKTYLLQDDFEAAVGTNATADGWTADGTDPADWIEISSTQFHGGSTSMFMDGNTATADRQVYKAFTQQTSGTFTISFWVYVDQRSSDTFLAVINSGSYSWATSFVWFLRTDTNGSLISAGDSTTLVANTTDAIAQDAWTQIEIEFDMDTNTADIWIDSGPTADATGVAFDNNVDPDRFYLYVRAPHNFPVYIDDLEVYTGARIQD